MTYQKVLTYILSLHLRAAYKLCNFLPVSVVFTLFVHQKYSFIEFARYQV